MRKFILLSLFFSVFVSASAVGGALYWLFDLESADQKRRVRLKDIRAEDIAYTANPVTENRGRILAVVTSANTLGATGRPTGYELTELARAYWVFTSNGFQVDVVSPQGGEAPAVIDAEDMNAFDFAFLNDAEAQAKIQSTLPITAANFEDYRAVFFVGGKGAMFDFPNNRAIKSLVQAFLADGKVISAVCHGPAALLGAKTTEGRALLNGRNISAFTNAEELLLMNDARTVFPFLLEDALVAEGAHFQEGAPYLEQVTIDGTLITAQNPWSVWSMADAVVAALGYVPKPREKTAEENTVDALAVYEQQGYMEARQALNQGNDSHRPLLMAMHGLLALKEAEIVRGMELFRLAHAAQERAL